MELQVPLAFQGRQDRLGRRGQQDQLGQRGQQDPQGHRARLVRKDCQALRDLQDLLAQEPRRPC